MAELDPKQVEPLEIPEAAVPFVPETVEPVVVDAIAPAVVPLPRSKRVYGGMWGPVEIAAVTAGALTILCAMMLYFFFVVPSNRELARNKSEADRLNAEMISAKSKYGEITSSETQVGKLVASVDDFETRFLPAMSNGQQALYQRLNGLIRGYGLINTTGPDYAPLEKTSDNSGQQTEEEKGRSKFKSLYPGVYVTMTLEGSYQNLRHFIREIETGREFIIISAIELAPSDTEAPKDSGTQTVRKINPNPIAIAPGGKGLVQPGGPNGFPAGPQQPQSSARPRGKTKGETVSLHMEMAAYFRRPNFVPMSAAPSAQ